MNTLTKAKTRETIDDFEQEIAERKAKEPKPATYVIDLDMNVEPG